MAGTEFQSANRTVMATKLQENDELVFVSVVSADQHVVLQTKNGYFLRFPLEEIPEKKKAAVGVRGIRMQEKDGLETVWLLDEGEEKKIQNGEKQLTLTRLKVAKRDGKGTKNR